jgi:hypothetical protein
VKRLKELAKIYNVGVATFRGWPRKAWTAVREPREPTLKIYCDADTLFSNSPLKVPRLSASWQITPRSESLCIARMFNLRELLAAASAI